MSWGCRQISPINTDLTSIIGRKSWTQPVGIDRLLNRLQVTTL
jgi:hypothetical protein